MTICIDCKHRTRRGSELFCSVAPVPLKKDVVTGEMILKRGTQKNELCRDINDGSCVLFYKGFL